jgi:hypothetical protein
MGRGCRSTRDRGEMCQVGKILGGESSVGETAGVLEAQAHQLRWGVWMLTGVCLLAG